MKKITLEILAGLIFLIAVIFLLEFLFRNYENGIDRIMGEFLIKKERAEVILISNSHGLPLNGELKRSKNTNTACLTIGGMDLFWMQALFKRFAPEMPRAKYVIFNCDPELLGFNQTISGLQYMNRMMYQYADTMYGNRIMDKILARSNFFRSNRDLDYLFGNRSHNEFMISPEASKTNAFTDEECKVRAEEISERRFSKKYFSENLSYIISILRECRRHNKRVIVFQTPKCDCLKIYISKKNLSDAAQALDSVFLANQINLFNFSKDTTFHREEFSNPDHLTLEASRKLMTMINEKIFALYGDRPIDLQQR